MSSLLVWIETMPVSPNVVRVHTREKRERLPVTVHVRRDKPDQWQWQFESRQGKSMWHSGDLDTLRHYWRMLSLE